MTKSKRFWFAVSAFVVNTILFAVGMATNTDLIALGTGMTMLNAPVYAYILGESLRKSRQEKSQVKEKTILNG